MCIRDSSVTMEDMIHHSAAVSRGIKDTLLITDMPFMSYQTSVYDAAVSYTHLAQADGADYLGSGAVFGSTTKLNAKPMTKKLLREITAAVDIPVSYTHLDVYKRQPLRWVHMCRYGAESRAEIM